MEGQRREDHSEVEENSDNDAEKALEVVLTSHLSSDIALQPKQSLPVHATPDSSVAKVKKEAPQSTKEGYAGYKKRLANLREGPIRALIDHHQWNKLEALVPAMDEKSIQQALKNLEVLSGYQGSLLGEVVHKMPCADILNIETEEYSKLMKRLLSEHQQFQGWRTELKNAKKKELSPRKSVLHKLSEKHHLETVVDLLKTYPERNDLVICFHIISAGMHVLKSQSACKDILGKVSNWRSKIEEQLPFKAAEPIHQTNTSNESTATQSAYSIQGILSQSHSYDNNPKKRLDRLLNRSLIRKFLEERQWNTLEKLEHAVGGKPVDQALSNLQAFYGVYEGKRPSSSDVEKADVLLRAVVDKMDDINILSSETEGCHWLVLKNKQFEAWLEEIKKSSTLSPRKRLLKTLQEKHQLKTIVDLAKTCPKLNNSFAIIKAAIEILEHSSKCKHEASKDFSWSSTVKEQIALNKSEPKEQSQQQHASGVKQKQGHPSLLGSVVSLFQPNPENMKGKKHSNKHQDDSSLGSRYRHK